MRGPGHNSVLHDGDDWWLVHHWYDAAANGVPTLGIRALTWTADGWPQVPGAVLPTTTSTTSTTAPATTVVPEAPPAASSPSTTPAPAAAVPATPRLTG